MEDFDKALEVTKDEPPLLLGRGLALEGLGRHAEADVAFRRALAEQPRSNEAELTRMNWAYGFAVAHRLPHEARQAFVDKRDAEFTQ